jgi:hypothetical protein
MTEIKIGMFMPSNHISYPLQFLDIANYKVDIGLLLNFLESLFKYYSQGG